MKTARKKDSFVVDDFKDNKDAHGALKEADNKEDKLTPAINKLMLKTGQEDL